MAAKEIVTMLDPAIIIGDDNIRYDLKADRVKDLQQEILERGEILQAIEVEPMSETQGGVKYRIVFGHYRHAAALAINAEGGGIQIPCKVLSEPLDPITRLQRQLAENLRREDPSYMDHATAIHKMFEAGMDRKDIRDMFRRPGGKKGNKTAPVSNSWLNIVHSFLQFPKKIQNMIHKGEINFEGAYRLTKVTKAKQEEVVAAILEARQKELDRLSKIEEQVNEAEVKEAAKAAKVEDIAGELEQSQAAYEAALSDQATKAKKAERLYKKAERTGEDDDVAAYNAAEEEAKSQEKAVATLLRNVEKLKGKVDKLTTPKEKVSKAISGSEVVKAAKDAGESATVSKLNATAMRRFVQDMALPGGDDLTDQLLQSIGKALSEAFDGKITEKTAYSRIAKSARSLFPKHFTKATE